MSHACILIVEDDPDIRRLVADLLRREQFRVEEAGDGRQMDAALRRVEPDLIVLDQMLPGEDGLAILRRLRLPGTGLLPVLMLTAKSDEVDKVLGLEMGADDYLVKPFGPRELVARVRALLRRGRPAAQPLTECCLRFDVFLLDLGARQLHAHRAAGEPDQPIALTHAEFELLACFAHHPRKVLSRDQILDWTRGRVADGPFDRTVDMLISRLRRKLDAASPGTGLISTVRNGGYLLTVQVQAVASGPSM